jgi:hypothetical protein
MATGRNLTAIMGVLDGLLHLLNFIAPAFGLGVIAASLTKLLWRRELAGVRWQRLAQWASGASLVALVAGLVVYGQDGHMGTYVAMVLACAAALWLSGFGPLRRSR